MGGGESAFRVMVVDDSAVIRGLLSRALEADPDVKVVTSAPNGEIAVAALSRHDIELVVLDIEMPVMDGLTALPKLLEVSPGLPILMASTLTRKNADVSLKAMSLGAADYVAKPTSKFDLHAADGFKRELLAKVKALAGEARRRKGQPMPARGEGGQAKAQTRPAVAAKQPKIVLRRASALPPQLLAIGSSTGGPQALFKVLANLDRSFDIPVLITQHMPATFTTLLAEHITRVSGRDCHEARDGEPLKRGTIYLAPGDFHMCLSVEAGEKMFRLNQSPPRNFCRPSVDCMLDSLTPVFGPRLLVAILTGMGADGRENCEGVVKAGGTLVAQDEATSVVWGMPGAVASAGLCAAVLPIEELRHFIRRQVTRSAA
jgi:two-component system chemotaxis response regulator CheB